MPEQAAEPCSLYAGPDLLNAAASSVIDPSLRGQRAGIVNGLGILADTVRQRLQPARGELFQVAVARGRSSATSSELSVAYAGSGTSRDWCISSAIDETEHIAEIRHADWKHVAVHIADIWDSVDIAFVEGLGAGVTRRLSGPVVEIPAWIKQRLKLEDTWPSQLAAMKRNVRQEISRSLRKYEYSCVATRSLTAFTEFYDELYRPHVSRQFGEAAIVVGKERFVRECQRGVLLQLLQSDDVVAGVVLRPVGNTLSIVWTGMKNADNDTRLPGASDALDYFSLLYAHLAGSKWLDFGPSRPDLTDGVLRYKRKWGCELTAGYVPQARIRWSCRNESAAVRRFLQQKLFVTSGRRGLIATKLWFDELGCPAEIPRLEQYLCPGISTYRVISTSPLPQHWLNELANCPQAIDVRRTDSVADALAQMR